MRSFLIVGILFVSIALLGYLERSRIWVPLTNGRVQMNGRELVQARVYRSLSSDSLLVLPTGTSTTEYLYVIDKSAKRVGATSRSYFWIMSNWGAFATAERIAATMGGPKVEHEAKPNFDRNAASFEDIKGRRIEVCW